MPSSSLLILSASDVDRITSTFSPQDLTSLMAHAFSAVSKSKTTPAENTTAAPPALTHSGDHATGTLAYTPHRTSIPSKNHSVLFMPARMVAPPQSDCQNVLSPSGTTTIKVVSVPYYSSSTDLDPRGLPASTLVLDEDTGNVKAIVNARNLTALRTAAGVLV